MLHGGFGTARQAENAYHWDTEPERGHFVVAYPDGLDRAWNTGGGSATELGSCPAPAPMSIIHIHGTADQNIPYNGGEGDGPGHIDGPSIPALNASWRRIDHCTAPVIRTTGAVTVSAAACPAGHTVELITIAGAGHQWPGATPSPFAQRILHLDPPSAALDATRVIWTFFAAHARRA
jgi:polyhydroxybutyrate depolymerase